MVSRNTLYYKELEGGGGFGPVLGTGHHEDFGPGGPKFAINLVPL